MNDGFDAAGALRAARSDGVLLRFVGEFAAASARPISGGDGVDESVLREAEERVGVDVPRRCGRHTCRSASVPT